ncbi:hypothetical protein L6452_37725 [Arctium lappa]|uniref:Uncharacterized protein n=1 Tax=Arctium lappa TaxID=4217 RepID=A0ACB8Y592_ARCLA|nr:hypothetical protein L6452_37725 [Arctium lappa]
MKTERTGKAPTDRKAGEEHSRNETSRSYCDVVKGKEKVNSSSEEIRAAEKNSDPLGRWEIHLNESSSGEEESPSPSEWTEDVDAEEEWAVDESVFIGKEVEIGKQGSQRSGDLEVVGELVQIKEDDVAQKDELLVGRFGEIQFQIPRVEGGTQESRQKNFEKTPCSKVLSVSNDEGGGVGVNVERRASLVNFERDFESGQYQGGFLEKGFGPGNVGGPLTSANVSSGPVDAEAALFNEGFESRIEA